jgi:peroxiredoxin
MSLTYMPLPTIKKKIAALSLLIVLVSSPIILIWYSKKYNLEEPSLIGMRIPSITVSTLSEARFSFDYRGKKHIILFFSIECPKCRNELSNFDSLYSQFKSRIDFFAISLSNLEETKMLVSLEKFLFPIFQGESDTLLDTLKINGTPVIFFVDEQQILRHRYLGDRSLKKDKQLLQEFIDEIYIR